MSDNKTAQERLGDKISEHLKRQNMTQQEFADRVGISRSSVNLIINSTGKQGKQGVPLETLLSIAKEIKFDLNDLLGVESNRYVILDTNVIMNRPQCLSTLLQYADGIAVPQTVINEINRMKDKGDERKRILASQCEGRLIELKKKHGDQFEILEEIATGETPDDYILSTSISYANEHVNDIVYLLSDDKDFLLKNKRDASNLRIITTNDISKIFHPQSEYDMSKSHKFFHAIRKKDMDQAKALSAYNIDFNFIDAYGYTPLIQAIRNNDIKMVKFLLDLEKDIDINAVDDKLHKMPPLTHAIQKNNIDIVKLLIDYGADVNAPGLDEKNGYNTPLMVAAWGGNFEIVRLLVEHGACINQQDKGNGFTPLIKAVFKNHPKIVKYLLEKGADREIRSTLDWKTALQYAYAKNDDQRYREIITLLEGN